MESYPLQFHVGHHRSPAPYGNTAPEAYNYAPLSPGYPSFSYPGYDSHPHWQQGLQTSPFPPPSPAKSYSDRSNIPPPASSYDPIPGTTGPPGASRAFGLGLSTASPPAPPAPLPPPPPPPPPLVHSYTPSPPQSSQPVFHQHQWASYPTTPSQPQLTREVPFQGGSRSPLHFPVAGQPAVPPDPMPPAASAHIQPNQSYAYHQPEGEVPVPNPSQYHPGPSYNTPPVRAGIPPYPITPTYPTSPNYPTTPTYPTTPSYASGSSYRHAADGQQPYPPLGSVGPLGPPFSEHFPGPGYGQPAPRRPQRAPQVLPASSFPNDPLYVPPAEPYSLAPTPTLHYQMPVQASPQPQPRPVTPPPALYSVLQANVCRHSVQIAVPALKGALWRAVETKVTDLLVRKGYPAMRCMISCSPSSGEVSILTIHALPTWDTSLNPQIIEIVRNVMG